MPLAGCPRQDGAAGSAPRQCPRQSSNLQDAADADWFGVAAWLSRQGSRRDVVGSFARNQHKADIEYPNPVGRIEARAEWDKWYAREYPRSAPGRAATGRLEAERARQRAATTSAARNAQARRELDELTSGEVKTAVLDLADILGELARFVPAVGTPERIAIRLERFHGDLDRVRSDVR